MSGLCAFHMSCDPFAGLVNTTELCHCVGMAILLGTGSESCCTLS